MALKRGLDRMIPADDPKKSSKNSTEKKSSTGSNKTSNSLKKTESKSKEVIKEVVKEVVKEVPADVYLKITDIEPNKLQPRKEFDEERLAELADSIKKYGVIEPVIVTKKGKSYEIIAGERRWRAARMAGLKEIPVIIREYTDKERMEVSLIENLQREDLNCIEEAMAYQSLIDEYGMKQEEVADRVSKSRSAVTNSLRLLRLGYKVKQMLVDEQLSMGHARALLAIEDPDVQYETALSVCEEGLSVRDTEQLVKTVNDILDGKAPEKKTTVKKEVDPGFLAVINQLQENLKTSLGSKVAIKPNGNKGKIEIEYVSSDDLERIIHIINTGIRN